VQGQGLTLALWQGIFAFLLDVAKWSPDTECSVEKQEGKHTNTR